MNVPNIFICQLFRFSYGPPISNLEQGIRQMEKMIEHWKENPLSVSTYEKESFGA